MLQLANREFQEMSSEEKQMDLPAKPRRMGRLFFLVAGVVCAAGITGGMMAVGSRPTAAPTRSAPAKVPQREDTIAEKF